MTPRLDLRAFRAEGYVRLPAFLDRAAVERARAAVEAAARHDRDNSLSLESMRFASNLYRHSPELRQFLCAPALVEVVAGIIGEAAWVRWDQAVWKGPGAPEFPWHQDNGYTGLASEHLQLWFALTAMTPGNGALEVVPGSHRRLEEHRWVGNHLVSEPPGSAVLIDARPGDLVAFSSYLMHRTLTNTTGEDRLAYVVELLPAGAEDPSVQPPHLVLPPSAPAAPVPPGTLGGPAGERGPGRRARIRRRGR